MFGIRSARLHRAVAQPVADKISSFFHSLKDAEVIQ